MGRAGPAGPAQPNPGPAHQRRPMTSPECSYVRVRHIVKDMNQKKRRDKVLFTAVVMMATIRQVKGQLLGITRVIKRRRENMYNNFTGRRD